MNVANPKFVMTKMAMKLWQTGIPIL